MESPKYFCNFILPEREESGRGFKFTFTTPFTMKEEYLHQVWLTKRLPVDLTLTDGRKLTILNTGRHNHESGPDFFNGSIELEGIRWNGNIEIHVKSSDWYAHKHHLDKAYNNVVLHVVYRHDKPVFIQGEEIPTLELESIIDLEHWYNYELLIKNKNWIPCENQINDVHPVFVRMQLEDMLISRLERKAQMMELRFQMLGRNLQQLQYEILAQSFGTKVNMLPFTELTQRMPVKTIWREGKSAAPALLLGAAGFLEEVQPPQNLQGFQRDWKFFAMKHRLQSMQKLSWKFKGLRPPGFPDVRILQFARIISRMQQDFSFFDKSVEQLLDFLKRGTGRYENDPYPLSESFQNLILINAVAPLLWWYGNHKSDPSYREKSLDLLQEIPAEQNEIVRNWKKLGVKPLFACDSQAMLELKHELCDQKKCLSCKIGHKILGK